MVLMGPELIAADKVILWKLIFQTSGLRVSCKPFAAWGSRKRQCDNLGSPLPEQAQDVVARIMRPDEDDGCAIKKIAIQAVTSRELLGAEELRKMLVLAIWQGADPGQVLGPFHPVRPERPRHIAMPSHPPCQVASPAG